MVAQTGGGILVQAKFLTSQQDKQQQASDGLQSFAKVTIDKWHACNKNNKVG